MQPRFLRPFFARYTARGDIIVSLSTDDDDEDVCHHNHKEKKSPKSLYSQIFYFFPKIYTGTAYTIPAKSLISSQSKTVQV